MATPILVSSPSFSRASRRRGLIASAVVLATSLGCLAQKGGERSETGECPEGEVCSPRTPDGLTFVGAFFFDDEVVQLGPVLVGGTFDLGLRNTASTALPAFEVAIEQPAVLGYTLGEGVFGPTNDEGQPIYTVDAHLRLEGLAQGASYVRILDAEDGTLFDRIRMRAFELENVVLVNVADEERTYLEAGAEERLGVRLVVDDGQTEIRAIDQGVELHVPGAETQPSRLYWDCFVYQVPDDATEVTFEVTAAGQVTSHTFPVQ